MSADSLNDLLGEAADILREMFSEGEVLVVSHYDADGLSAASIFTSLLEDMQVPFHLKIVEQLYPEILNEIGKLGYENVVFLDLGSGYKSLIAKMEAKRVLIVDHHLSLGDAPRVVELNPYLAGIDASKDISAAGTTYLLYRRLLPGKRDAVIHLAVTGALGDRQDAGPKFSLTGVNREIAEEAKGLGLLDFKVGLRLFGVSQRPLVRALANTYDPYLPGLTGNEAACYDFLRKIGIDPMEDGKLRKYTSLSPEEVKRLATGLIKYLLSKGVPLREAERIFGYIYLYLREPPGSPFHDLREYAYVLNALGRMESYGTALAVNKGFRGRYLVRTLEILRRYKKTLSRLLKAIEEGRGRVEKDGILLYLLGEEASPKLTGPLSSLLVSMADTGTKLVGVAASVDGEHVKVSLRRINEDYDVGGALQKISERLSAYGGGHPAAGGILIKKEKVKDLLSLLVANGDNS